MPELLLELLSEEIPARMQARAAEDLKRLVCERLARRSSRTTAPTPSSRRAGWRWWWTACRSASRTCARSARARASARRTKAVEGFLRAAGLASIAEAEVRETDKGSFYFAMREKPGAATAEVCCAAC